MLDVAQIVNKQIIQLEFTPVFFFGENQNPVFTKNICESFGKLIREPLNEEK